MEKIATIEVYFEDSEGSSDSRFNEVTRMGRVRLRARNRPFFERATKSQLADIFAHEMGHIISDILELPEQVNSKSDLFMANFGGIITPRLVRTEQKAWELANKMRGGNIDPVMQKGMLQTYIDGCLDCDE